MATEQGKYNSCQIIIDYNCCPRVDFSVNRMTAPCMPCINSSPYKEPESQWNVFIKHSTILIINPDSGVNSLLSQTGGCVKLLNSRPKISIAFPSGTTKNSISLIFLRFEKSTKHIWPNII